MNNFKINKNVDSLVITGNRIELYTGENYSKKFSSVEELIGLVKNYFSTYKYEYVQLYKLVVKGNEEKGLHLSDVISGKCTNKEYIGNMDVHCYKEYLPFVKCVLLDMGYEYSKNKGGKKKTLKK